MARVVLGPSSRVNSTVDIRAANASAGVLTSAEVEKRLRQKRSSAYVAAVTKLDTHGALPIREQVNQLVEAIRQEMPELSLSQLPVGIVAKCYLGAPYEVHTLDVAGDIIQHYKRMEPLPSLLEKARAIALHPGYAFIEVYTDCLRAVKDSGDVAVIKE